MVGGKLWSNTAKIRGSSVFLDVSTVSQLRCLNCSSIQSCLRQAQHGLSVSENIEKHDRIFSAKNNVDDYRRSSAIKCKDLVFTKFPTGVQEWEKSYVTGQIVKYDLMELISEGP